MHNSVFFSGESIILKKVTSSSENEFGEPIETVADIPIPNVIICPLSEQEITDAWNMYGRKAVYSLAIPSDDTNEWENAVVEFFGKKWRVVGMPLETMRDYTPLEWNKKVKVELYE